MKIGILNAYDARNRGDLAIVLCQTELLRRKFQNAEFFIFSHHAATNADVLDKPSVQSVESVVHLPPHGSVLSRLLHPLWDIIRWLLGNRSDKFEKFNACDLYVLCGGGYLYSSQNPLLSRNLACLCLEILFAVRTGKPVIQFPQSYGPLTKAIDRWLVQKVCHALPRLTPRYDDKLLVEWGYADKAIVMPDIVLLMRKLLPDLYKPAAIRQGLGIAPVNYKFAMRISQAAHEKLIEDLGEVCRYYHQHTGEKIYLFTQVCLPGDNDSVMVNELAARLGQLGVPYSKIHEQASLSEYISAMASLRAFIGSRMHACIFAVTARIPTISLAYQPKFQGLYRTLEMEKWSRPLNDWSVEWACQRLDEILDPASQLPRQIEARMNVLENQLVRQIEELLPATLANPSKTADSKNLYQASGKSKQASGLAASSALRFSIITPSFRSSKWLKLCIASVADQKGVEFEHIVQDSCSDDDTQNWLPHDARVKVFIEKDSGMYDAVNRGYRRATGDILAYLNCDEQYLPGALKAVQDFFEANPKVEVALAGSLVTDGEGKYLCHRHLLKPHRQGIWFRFPILTSSIFIRRRVIHERGLFFDTRWRDLGDFHWVLALMKNRVPMKVCQVFTSVFADTGENMNLKPNAIREKNETTAMIPTWVRKFKPVWIVHHRLRRLAAGHFSLKPMSYSIYTIQSPGERMKFDVSKPTGVWWSRL